jgi:xylulokinase
VRSSRVHERLVVAAVVGIDVGTTGVKAIALSEDGSVLRRAQHDYPLYTPRPGWTEQDPEQWWRATTAALDELRLDRIDGIGLTGQMHGLVVLDRHGKILRPAILWNDQRTARECSEIEDKIGLSRLIELTGNRALTGFTAPKLLWLRKNEPETYRQVNRVLLPKDYVRLRLTHERATDVADASGTLLFNVAQRNWSEEIMSALGVDPDWFPPALESPDVAGYTADGVAVAAGAGDQAAGALGVGINRPGSLSIALGTSGVVFAALAAYVADAQARLHIFCHAAPGSWHAMGVMLSAAGSLRWLRDAIGRDVPFHTLLAEAERWSPDSEGLTFLPYLAGERTPHADPDATGAFCGLTIRHDRGALVRSVLEGVAYGLRDSLQLMRELGVDADVARISGGGVRGGLWLRIIASVLRIPLEITAVEEGAAYGAALLGGVAGGVFRDVSEAIEACVSVRSTIDPVSSWMTAYEDGYEQFRALYPALRSVRREGEHL